MGNIRYIERCKWLLENRCTPDYINELNEDEIFVFGSRPNGHHVSGAAKLAVNYWGAKEGCGEGCNGATYAIPIHKHQRNKMYEAVERFITYASKSKKKFLILEIGCGKAGMDPSFVALMFRECLYFDNVYLPKVFLEELLKYYEIGLEISPNCNSLVNFPTDFHEKYKIPYGIETLCENSFAGCCCDLELPNSLKEIKRDAFSEMDTISEKLIIPKSVTFIDDDAFSCEYSIPVGILVYYKSYAYYYAKRTDANYECIDFDEKTFLRNQEIDNRSISCLSKCIERSINSLENTLKNFNTMTRTYDFGAHIAIARDFAVVLNDDGHLTVVGDNDNFEQLIGGEHLIKVTAGFDGYMALTDYGTIIPGPKSNEFKLGYLLEGLTQVKDIVSCEGHDIALHYNGCVTCIDEFGWDGPQFSDKINDWKDIVQVECGYDFILGLKSNGSLISVGEYYHCPDWKNVVQISAFNCYYGGCYTMAILADGRVVSDFCNVEQICNVIYVSVGNDCAVALKKDGTAYAWGDSDFVTKVESWRGIVGINCKFFDAVAILKDGTIVSTFKNK